MTRVLLRSEVAGLGKRGDICEVADGYARNYLLPKGYAIVATNQLTEQAARMRHAREVKDAHDREAAEAIARRLVQQVITLPVRAGPEGKLFGSVTAANIADAITAQAGIDVDRHKIHLSEPIKSLGTHEVTLRLHAEVEFPVTVDVVRA
jgi:large subunit ribosomal protein L9